MNHHKLDWDRYHRVHLLLWLHDQHLVLPQPILDLHYYEFHHVVRMLIYLLLSISILQLYLSWIFVNRERNCIILLLILEISMPVRPLCNDVDIVQWAPSSRHVLVSGGDDQQALVWDLSRQNSGGRSHSGTIREPTLAYNTESEINNLYSHLYLY